MRSLEPVTRPLTVHPGDTVEGRYRIIELLDVGGMGAVFLAEHLLLKRRVAIKFLHVELTRDTDMIKRFMKEAHAAGTLGHPNIVEATDMGFLDEHTPYIVFEYLEGALLTEEIYRVSGMPPRRALAIARQIASALEAAHNAGMVHLDLKNDNIFLGDKNGAADHATVIDFGISKFMEVDAESTQPGVPIGTPEFMAPEQIETPDLVDKRADIYALGVCLYEMLTARRPFAGDDPRVLFHRIIHEPAPPLARLEVPANLDAFVFELLAKDPATRPPTMREVVERIDRLQLEAVRERRATRTRRRTEQSQPVTPPPVARPSSLAPWVLAMFVAGSVGGVLHALDVRAPDTRRAEPPPVLEIDAETEQLNALVGAQLRTTRLRADSIARTPMLRAAIEADAATVDDVLRSERILEPTANETIEVFQATAGKLASLSRAPRTAAPLSGIDDARILRTSRGLLVEASAPIANHDTKLAGAVVVSALVDLVPIEQKVAARARKFVAAATTPPVIEIAHTPERELLRRARTTCLGIAALLLLYVAWMLSRRE
ncbi:MAG: serine/threonine protein kinase [Kofleriaceae bacterium]|nr:serine/threonine protein kinase [Kofleriaceae bacterium]